MARHLPGLARLQARGLTFEQAFCAAGQCSPSRACLLTGSWADVHGVQTVVNARPGLALPPADRVPNVASMLRAAGYEVVYKGKWHLSHPVDPAGWSQADIAHLEETYGFSGWNPPDAGIHSGAGSDCQDASPARLATLGGGLPDNDGRCLRGPGGPEQTPGWGQGALDYLARVAALPAGQRPPFCLFVSLTNPHDICYYPETCHCPQAGYPSPVPDLGVDLPASAGDDLQGKPWVQAACRELSRVERWPSEVRRGFVNFYAYLHTVVDEHVQALLEALEAHGLAEDTLVFLTSDHGELALAHGLRDKAFCAYEEVIGVPLVVSNPRLFPRACSTRALWSHVDLAATLAELAGAAPIGVGVSQAPVLRNPSASVRDWVLYAFDDEFGGLPCTAPAAHLRALREERYTYAVYFTARYQGEPGLSPFTVEPPYDFELYDNLEDPLQMINLVQRPEHSALWGQLHRRLTAAMQSVAALPPGWPLALPQGLQGEAGGA